MTITHTIVTYPGGACKASAVVVHVADYDKGQQLIITDTTPFHPVNFRWPDQPADRGEIDIGGKRYTVTDVQEAAWVDAQCIVGAAIADLDPALAHYDLVAHIIDVPAKVSVGETVELIVDADYRQALNYGHSACHLSALALNTVMKDFWRKEVVRDALGHPDFDRLTIKSSFIEPMGSKDCYRLGKSIRKKGLNCQDCFDQLAQITEQTNQQLAAWLATPLTITVTPAQSTLTEKRHWRCQVPEGLIEIPCGGTHADSFEGYGIEVKLSASEYEANEILMATRVYATA